MFYFLLDRVFKFNNNRNYKELSFIPKNNFDDWINNILTFVDLIISIEDVQKAIKQTIDIINKDTSIDPYLKYEDDKIFKVVNLKYYPFITKMK